MKKGGGQKRPGKESGRAKAGSDSSFRLHPSSLPLVAVIMGSTSDWETMRHAADVLRQFDVAHECRVVSAHRTPLVLAEFAAAAEGRGLEVIIAGAGGGGPPPG